MHETLGSITRMEAVQAPIVPIIGEMLRQTPDAISLGQGVVHYGPPPQAAEAARAAILRPGTDQYQGGAGLPALLDRIAHKLSAENGIDLARGCGLMVTAGANMAFMHAVLATTSPGDEVILPVPFYFNHDMAIQMAGCHVVRQPHACGCHGLAQQSERCGLPRNDAAPDQ
jgi:aspartate/methionine/tyrosine aminotransferase